MQKILNDRIFQIGLIFFFLSLIIFHAQTGETFGPRMDIVASGFLINYGLFLVYFILVFATNKKRSGKYFKFSSLSHNILLLLLANISAFALNQEIAVFQVSTDWLSWFLILLNGGLLYFSIFKNYLNHPVNHVLVALLTAGTLFGFYGVLYVMPQVGVSIIGFWLFGFSLHTFVPLFWLLLLSRIVYKFIKNDPAFKISAIVGIAIPVVFIALFTGKWMTINHQITDIYEEAAVPLQEQELPTWIKLAQRLDKGVVTKKILKSDMVYTIADLNGSWFWGGRNWNGNERRKHDPLVVIASVFSPPLGLDEDTNRWNRNYKERTLILNTLFDSRHQTERKLWSGNNLATKNILTNIQLFPEYRIAYTEKFIDIENEIHQERSRWQGGLQEALYSFYLPEGSVITSASLWVEGEERPSYLTTRNKADSAYTTIVGRERRDPLLLHWQEGNRVTVRVFPVSPDNPRKFKIGITTPLGFENDQLIYKNIDFAGPYWKDAKEQINLIVSQKMEGFESSLGLQPKGDHWSYNGSYRSNWHLKCTAPTLSTNSFSFNGKSYQLQANARQNETFTPTEVYLDINGGWSKSEFRKIVEQYQNIPIYIYQNKLLELNKVNQNRLFEELQTLNFSLFPFHKIKNPKTALVFSKNNLDSPVLGDLKGTEFSNSLNRFMSENENPVRVFNLGEELSFYLRTLKELRTIEVMTSKVSKLSTFSAQQSFSILNDNPTTVAIDNSDLRIQEIEHPIGNDNAPDHLMRLFTYNDLMKKIGRNYFKKEKYADDLVEQAEEGYVVTPVSSLIVLETQADYDRFDIKRNKDSLKNASFKDSGSVPEPHEWLLIILCLIVGGPMMWRHFFG